MIDELDINIEIETNVYTWCSSFLFNISILFTGHFNMVENLSSVGLMQTLDTCLLECACTSSLVPGPLVCVPNL